MSVSINDQNDQISTTLGVLRQADTGGLVVASGVDVGKPTPVGNNGLIRYNTTNNALEVVVNGAYHTFAFTDSITGFLPLTGGTLTGGLAVIAGTASAPGLYFNNSAITGLFSPSANVFCITSNGTESLRVDNVGNVGIGKTPSVRLDVSGTGKVAAFTSTSSDYLIALTGQTTTVSTPPSIGARGNSLVVATNASLAAQFAIDTSGNVGINTTGSAANPTYALDIATSLSAGVPSIRANSLNESILRLQSNGASGTSWDLNSAGGTTSLTAGNFYIRNGSTTALMLDTTGYAYTTTPPTNDNSTKIPTTAWVRAALAAEVIVAVQVFASSGTYTPTANMVKCIVEMVGGGGSGGGAGNGGSAQGASGGGSGGYLKALLTAAQVGASQSVTIGTGGVGAVSGPSNGNSGGTTSLGSLLSCTGGGAGQQPAGGSGGVAGGSGGTPTVSTGTAILTLTGQAGSYGMQNFLAVSGNGGSNPLGLGGVQVGGNATPPGNVAGQAGTGYGSGSGGAIDGVGGGDTAKGSANGQSGIIIITEYILG
jgi:hypothetical protein